MIDYRDLIRHYQNKRVFVTGHTGFKGSWLCHILHVAGAIVEGYSLEPPTSPSLFDISKLERDGSIKTVIGDVRDLSLLSDSMRRFEPEFVMHLAAQPLVRESYKHPVETYSTNVMGTVHVLEAARACPSVRSILNVTTDKVYENREWVWGYRENEPLNGRDPYSNSKSCSELVTHSYARSFFDEVDVRVSTARAGNVIGGGDFSADRIVPDCVRAALSKSAISVRNPGSVRPYQHVLEPLFAYLLICDAQLSDSSKAGCYNIGPGEEGCLATGELVDHFCHMWGEGLLWNSACEVDAPHEASLLKLDCSSIVANLDWSQRWDIREAIKRTVEWTKAWRGGEDVSRVMLRQIEDFISHA